MEIVKNVFSVGVKDWNRRTFDALIPLPQGTSYNAYLVQGEKTALIDTVNPGFENELIANINKVCPVSQIDYLIMNHAEPDHASAIPLIMKETQAILVASEKGALVANEYYKVTKERIRVVKEGDTIDLGGKTLKFIDAPWLHWPETMFTYLVEDKILFTCDFFGAHTAYPTYDEESEDLILSAKKYFGEIMMPFRAAGKKALEKLKSYEIKMIAPSHGPIYKNPNKILEQYTKWTSGESSNKAVIAYVSMWGSTEKLVKHMAENLISQGIQVCIYNLVNADVGDIIKDLVDCKTLILGSPSVLGSIHPLALNAITLIKALKPPVQYAAFLTSYGWASSGKQVSEMLSGMQIVGTVEVKGPPIEDDFQKVLTLSKEIAKRMKE
jgi:flavorubredoxin